MSSSRTPNLSSIHLPTWLTGNDPSEYVRLANLRGQYKKDIGRWLVQTSEQYFQQRPDLVRLVELDTSCDEEVFKNEPRLATLLEAEPAQSGRPGRSEYLAATHERLSPRIEANDIAAIFHAFQIDLSIAPPSDVPEVIYSIARSIGNIRIGEHLAIDRPPAMILHNMSALLFRTRLPAILLAVEQDERFRSASPEQIQRLADSGVLSFRASYGLSDGAFLMDVYTAPLIGSLSPFVWALAAPRTLGQTIFPLSHPLNGWYAEPHHLMETIIRRGSDELPSRPSWNPKGSTEAINWWVSRLNLLFGWLSDPVVFTNASGDYLPSVHLQYVLTIEQIFSRVSSLLRVRDPVAARSLLFGILDSISDRLTGRGIEVTASPRKAAERLEELRASVPAEAHGILLTNAVRAVGSLDKLARGFYTAQPPGSSQPSSEPQVNIRRIDGSDVSMPTSRAVATYVGLLRNATHGFGGKQGAKGSRDADALLAHHDGEIPNELSLLAYFYLLDFLSRPDDIKTYVSRTVKKL